MRYEYIAMRKDWPRSASADSYLKLESQQKTKKAGGMEGQGMGEGTGKGGEGQEGRLVPPG